MHITQKELDPYTFTATIALEKGELQEYLKAVTSELAQSVTIEGFRKGKAPRELVEKQLNPEMVRQEALEHALSDSFTRATQEKGWDVMRTSELKVLTNTADVLEYSIVVAVWPAVTLPDLKTIQVLHQGITISDAEIDEALDTVRNMRATFLDKTGPAAQGDRVEVDFDASLDGNPIEGGQSRNHPLIIGGRNFMPGFEEELVGLAAGQAKQFSLTAPENYYEPKLAGKTINFSVTMRRVQAVLKPAADDAFAVSLGRFENLAQLKDSLRAGLMNEKSTKEHQRVRLAILDAIIAAAPVPTPEAMVSEELTGMLQRFGDDLRGRGMELPLYLARLKKTEEDLKKDWRPEAERQVKIALILREIAKEQNIAVLPNELEDAVKETLGELMRTGQLHEDQVDPERVRSALAQRILTDKTLELLEQLCATKAA